MVEKAKSASTAGNTRNSKVGKVVSSRMAKTIVVEVIRQKAHPMYRRVISRSKKFYAHDENNSARVGDVVRIEETRPLSKLKRWRLTDVIRRAALVPVLLDEEAVGTEKQPEVLGFET